MLESVMLPDWMQERLVSDEAFADAYHETVPHRRALLKSTIARLHALLGERRVSNRSTASALETGMRSIVWELRLDTLVVTLPPGFSSPSRLLAAIVPAQLAGVREILVVCLRPDAEPDAPAAESAISPAVLAALELAGVETCLDLDMQEFRNLPAILEEAGQWGAFITLETGCTFIADFLTINADALEVHCWFDDPDTFSLDDLRWLFGDDAALYCWGNPPASLPDGVHRGPDDFDAFQEVDKFLALAPEERIKEISTSAHLACSKEALGLWLWPGLTPDAFFAARRIVIG
ncbi:histidinol dehydrogenase [Megalodesulfovibrio gigas]|uniref:Uncharacterized protein n=1 Tax=Megalodesulfovibrio gigas (strain ATCC 19364 / DSM 1382 / NCIMB 9332 / VKM B-1759) TaxID=1121448 RepID=T2GCF1_MEGG1|nr:histidinol dehydrogenase [Megalodesulfovibrio gigas]AGW14255.1 hypothetical protein DGI_2519 [Megalodesulfovibrio gigas DSM 1382 = ATCC 19364]